MFKEMQSVVCPNEAVKNVHSIYSLKDETFGIVQQSASLIAIHSMDSCFKQFLGEEMYFAPFPTDTQSTDITDCVRWAVGINANSKNPKEAFEFIKVHLSKNFQTPRFNERVVGFPVCIEAWSDEIRHYMSYEVIKTESESYGKGDDNGNLKLNILHRLLARKWGKG
jgi:hypothetical protein